MSMFASGAASPFEHNHADPWARNFLDLPRLNASVTDTIVTAINALRAKAREERSEIRSTSLLVLGPAGAGKTHLFARLRRKLGPRAVFVHLRPLVGTEMTPRYVLGQIVQQLAYDTANQGFRQLDALVGASLAHLGDEPPDLPRAFLDHCIALGDFKREKYLEWAVERTAEDHRETDETYLARLIETPFMPAPKQRASLAWLAGRELEESQMKRLGVTAGLSDERIIQSLQTLGIFAAPGAPIVLVFDQLENLIDPEGAGNRVRAYANLVAELVDTMRGFVIVQMALDTEWEQAILSQLGQSQKTRLAARTELISLPRPDDVRELVRLWVEELPEHDEPFPWPFGERRVKAWCETPGMTPRMLMIACRQALAEGPQLDSESEQPSTPVEDAAPDTQRAKSSAPDESIVGDELTATWEKHIVAARRALDEAAADRRSADPARLIGGVACSLRFIDGIKTSRVDARQAIQVEGTAGAHAFAICLLHQTHPRAVASALDRTTDAMKRGTMLIVRGRALEFPPTWKAVLARRASLVQSGARWMMLERDDAARLLALESFLAAARSRDLEDSRGKTLDEAQVTDWIARTLAVSDWPTCRALSGDGVEDDADDVAPSPGAEGAARAPRAAIGDAVATIHACLANLRVASLERLVREVVRARPDTTRTEVVETLALMNDRVRWFGRSIVSVSEGWQ